MVDRGFPFEAPRYLSHYELGPLLGSGGMGMVFEGEDRRDGTRVAVKLLYPHLAASPAFRDRFAREGHMAALLRSPYTVRLLEHGVDHGRCFIVMEFVDGETLGAALRDGALAPQRAVRIMVQVARALEEAEARGVMHRDIKPENVLIGPGDTVKVTDFGLAQQVESVQVSISGGFMGTVLYGAPELARGEADHRSDIYALGATLYQALTGEPPFSGPLLNVLEQHRFAPVPMTRLEGVPRELREVVRRCMEKRPERRYQSAGQVAYALERAAQEMERAEAEAVLEGCVVSEPPTAFETGGVRRGLAGMLTAAALAVVALVGAAAVNGPIRANAPGDGSDRPSATGAVTQAAQAGAVPAAIPAPPAPGMVSDAIEAGLPQAPRPAPPADTPAASPAAAAPTPTPTPSPAAPPKATPAKTASPSPAPAPSSTPAPPPVGELPPHSVRTGVWRVSGVVTANSCGDGPAVGAAFVATYTIAASGGGWVLREAGHAEVSGEGGAFAGSGTLMWPELSAFDAGGGGYTLVVFEFSGPAAAAFRREAVISGRGTGWGTCAVVTTGEAALE